MVKDEFIYANFLISSTILAQCSCGRYVPPAINSAGSRILNGVDAAQPIPYQVI